MFKGYLKVLIFISCFFSSVYAKDFYYETDLINKKANVSLLYTKVQKFLNSELKEPKNRDSGFILVCENISDLKTIIAYEKNRVKELLELQKVEEIRPLNEQEHQKILELSTTNYLSLEVIDKCIVNFEPRYISVSGNYFLYKNELIAELYSINEDNSETVFYVLALGLMEVLDLSDKEISKYID